MRLDLLIASASAGVLVYSGRVLILTARLRPEDIIAAYKSPMGAGAYTLQPEDVPFPIFPEYDIVLDIRDALDRKIGFTLLAIGTIGGVGAIIVDAFTRTWNVPSGLDIASAVAALALGYGVGWWWKDRSGWYDRRARRLLVHCFLLWLEREVGDPKAEGAEFGLTVISTARHSGFTLMGEQDPFGTVLSEADQKAIPRRVVALARDHRYRWRRDDFRQWASKVAGKND